MRNTNLLLAIFAVLSLGISQSVYADEIENGFCNKDKTCKYTLDNQGNLTIFGSGAVERGYLSQRSDIITITVEKGITTINNSAFYSLSNLRDLTVAKTVTYIGENATVYARQLENVTIMGEDINIHSNDGIYAIKKLNISCIPGSKAEEFLKKLKPNANFSAYDPMIYQHNSDGSISIFDDEGNFVGKKNAKIFTPAEAAALSKPTGNTVSITW